MSSLVATKTIEAHGWPAFRFSFQIAPITLQWNNFQHDSGGRLIVKGLVFTNKKLTKAQGELSCRFNSAANAVGVKGGIYPSISPGRVTLSGKNEAHFDLEGKWTPTNPFEFTWYVEGALSDEDYCDVKLSHFETN